MRKRNVLAAAVVAVALTACGGTAKMAMQMDQMNQLKLADNKMVVGDVTTSLKDVPDQFMAAVKGYLDSELRQQGLLAGKGAHGANRVSVNITYYRMRSGFTRMMFGVFAGKDGIDGKVAIKDAKGRTITTLDASSYNVTAMGGPDDIARMFAKNVAKTLEKNIASLQKTETVASH